VLLTSVLLSTAIENQRTLVTIIFKFTWMLFVCSYILHLIVNPDKCIVGNGVFLSGHATFVTVYKHSFIIFVSVKSYILFINISETTYLACTAMFVCL
jgi:hypothetical protein